jgi:hypothetical protein
VADVDRASINRLAGEVAIVARDLRLNSEAISSCLDVLESMKENIETILAACTEDPQDGPESDLTRLLKAMTVELANNSAKLAGVEAALDRQTAAIAALRSAE